MTQQRDVFAETRATYSVLDVWRWLYPQFHEPKLGMNKSPIREERTPSFSIHDGGAKWKDHGGDCGGDVIEFIKVALQTDYAGVRTYLEERLGISKGSAPTPVAKTRAAAPAARQPRKSILWPAEVIEGTEKTWQEFAERRRLSTEGVKMMVQLGVLRFMMVENRRCYVVTDRAHRSAEIRRWDGKLFGQSKAFPLSGVEKAWWPGLSELDVAGPKSGIFVTEGATDLLTAFDQYIAYRKSGGKRPWIPAGLLGSTVKTLDPDAAEKIKGRRVRLVPDADDAGDKMAEHWKPVFLDMGCVVDVVKFPRGKDLSDMAGTIKPEVLFDVAA